MIRWLFCLVLLSGCGVPNAETPPEDTKRSPRIIMKCDHGCPVPAWIEVPKLPTPPDARTTRPDATPDANPTDATPDAAQPDMDATRARADCARAYAFSVCCGNGVCDSDESPFFCPEDCA